LSAWPIAAKEKKEKKEKKAKRAEGGEAEGAAEAEAETSERDYDELVKRVSIIATPLASKKLTRRVYKARRPPSRPPSPLPLNPAVVFSPAPPASNTVARVPVAYADCQKGAQEQSPLPWGEGSLQSPAQGQQRVSAAAPPPTPVPSLEQSQGHIHIFAVLDVACASLSLCIFAGDISPIDVITHMPVMCEDSNVPYCFVPSKEVRHSSLVLLHEEL
jgi:hypothetical protein